MTAIWKSVCRVMAAIVKIFLEALALLFGSWSWTPSPWQRALFDATARARGALSRNTGKLALAVFAAAAMWLAYPLIKSRMPYLIPDRVSAQTSAVQVQAPGRTDYENGGKPLPLVLEFAAQAAPLAKASRDIPNVFLSPAQPGKWSWSDERHLMFTPSEEWPVGRSFSVRLGPKALAPHVQAPSEYEFSTPAFTAVVANAQFYQDPVQVNQRRAVFELRFSHPVVPADFEKHVKLAYTSDAASLLAFSGPGMKYNISYDKYKVNVTIQSEPLEIPRESTPLALRVDKGAKAQRGGDGMAADLVNAVNVPGLFGLTVQSVEARVVTGANGEPEHMLNVTADMAINEREMARAVTAWVLPRSQGKEEGKVWEDLAEVTDAVLKNAKPLKLAQVPGERDSGESHSFRFEAEPGSYLFVRVAKGLKSVGGYQSAGARDTIALVKAFAPDLQIMSSGSLLALNGERKLPVLVRDLPGVELDIGRVLPHQLHLMVSQSEGSFAKPEFYRGITPDSLTERFERKIALKLKPGKTHYESIDFGEYLKGEGSERRGIFLVTVRGYDPKQTVQSEEEPQEQRRDGEGCCEGDGEQQERADTARFSDRRLVMLTDLGLITKRALDGSQQVFVQSISSGQPVAGATIEVWGRNGLVLNSSQTDASGSVRLPDLRGYTREKTPVLLLVKKSGDMSFMPLNRADRTLDVSRFDVGGQHSTGLPNQMRAYLFSDRGMYRPGDTIQVGVIVKSGDWAQNLKDLPVEAEVIDARGQSVKREKLKLGPAGMAEISHTTSDSSPTGTYTIHLNLPRESGQPGGEATRLGSTTVAVQEFLPDRSKIALKLSAPAGEGWIHPKDLQAKINVQTLFGAAAPDRKVEATVTLNPSYPSFANWSAYKFFDPARAKQSFRDTLGDVRTDAEGNASVELGLDRYAAATYQLRVLARAFEPEGGRSVAGEVQAMVSDAPYLVGFKAADDLWYVTRGAKRSVSLLAIDPQARKLAVPGLKLERIETRVLSVLVKQRNGLYKYESRAKEITLKTENLNLPAAETGLALDTATPGNFAYLVKNAEGALLNRIDYTVAGAANVSRSLERNAELRLTLDKKEYKPGDEIEINIHAPYVGAGLITIERDKVIAHKWFKTDKTATVQKITLPKDYDGNGYVMVQFVRDPASDEIYMSPLSYGVAPFSASLERRTTKISLHAPELVKPGETVKMRIDSATPARAIVFAIDEGILQVAGYKNPEPLAHFFQKRALEVTTAQTLDLILPEFKKLMQAAPGGDAGSQGSKHLNPFKRKRDLPVAYWSGVVDVNGSKELSYTVPESFNGSLRVMAVAVTDSSAAAAATKTTVRGDLILLPTVPVALTPGDEVDIGVGLANQFKGSGKNAPIALSLKVSPSLEIVGPANQTLTVSEQSEGSTKFRVRARAGAQASLGSASVVFTAQYKHASARLSTDISVRPASAFVTLVQTGRFKGGGELAMQGQFYPNLRQSELAVSTSPWAFASGMASYLRGYPYGCTEQITSQMLPTVLLSNRPELAKDIQKSGVDPKVAFARTVAVLRSRQTADGGFGLYSPGDTAHAFATIYATQMLLEARERKLPVPEDMLQRVLGYLSNYVTRNDNSPYELRSRALAVYLLTRSGVVTTAALVNLRNHPAPTDLANAYIAASYQILKQDKLAQQLMDPIWKDLTERAERGQGYRNFDYYYDSLVHDATVVTLVARHFPQRAKDMPLEVFDRMAKVVTDGWYSSQSAAALIMATDAYSVAAVAGSTPVSVKASDAQGKVQALELAAPKPYAKTDLPLNAKTLKLSGGGVPLFYTVAESGFEANVPATAISNGIEIVRDFLDANNNPVTELTLGDEVTVRLKVRAIGKSLRNVAVVDVLPGGMEPVLGSASDGDDASTPLWQRRIGARGWSWNLDYVDIREDRLIMFGDLHTSVGEVRYKVRATNIGSFVVPGVFGEAMYERKVFGRSEAGRLTIKARK